MTGNFFALRGRLQMPVQTPVQHQVRWLPVRSAVSGFTKPVKPLGLGRFRSFNEPEVSHLSMNVTPYRIFACAVVAMASALFLSEACATEQINVQCIVDSQVYQATAEDMSVGPDGTVTLQGIIDCGPGTGGGTPPPTPPLVVIDFDATQMPGSTITIPESDSSASVPVYAIIQGYGAGAPYFQDKCTVSVEGGSSAELTPGQSNTTLNLGVGDHTLRLACNRSFGSEATQNLHVVNFESRSMPISIVQEGGGGTEGCTALANHFTYVGGGPIDYISNYNSSTHSGGWKNPQVLDFHPGLGTPWRSWTSPWSSSGVVSIRSWEFTPPDNTQLDWRKGEHSTGQFAIAISECPGKFLAADRPGSSQNQANCIFNGANLRWATGNRQNIVSCNLEAGKKYYLNLAAIDISHYEQCMATPGASGCIKNNFDCLVDGCVIQIEAVKE